MITCWWLVGGSHATNPGGIGWDIVDRGWMHVAQACVEKVFPVLEACRSPRRVFLHNPFGLHDTTNSRGQMSMHQERYAEANDAMDLVTGTFRPAWAPIIRTGAEIVAYVGFDERTKDRPLTRLNNLQQTFNRILGTGCAVGFDSVAAADYTKPESNVLRLFESWGVKCYAEGPPLPHWDSTPGILDATAYDGWQSIDMSLRKAEMVVRVDTRKAWVFQCEQAIKIHRMGMTPALSEQTFMDYGDAVIKMFGQTKTA